MVYNHCENINVELTAIVSKDPLLFRAPMPYHYSTVLGASHHVTVLTDVTLRPRDTRHDIIMSKYRLYH